MEKKSLLLSLPDELLEICIARVSRLYHHNLYRVCKRLRSLIASPELYEIRSLLNLTESCLYVCLNTDVHCRWFTLCREPNQQTLKNNKNKSSAYVLVPVPIPPSPLAIISDLVAAGSNIYVIERLIFGDTKCKTSVLDCRSHTWSEAPRLPWELCSISASTVDQKIYVAGDFYKKDSGTSENMVVTFDTKTRVWDPVPIPSEIQTSNLFGNTCLDGKFHLRSDGEVVAYNAKEGRWDVVQTEMRYHLFSDSYCAIDNVLYSGYNGEIKWYDCEVRRWKKLKGLVGLRKTLTGRELKLADYGGKMAVLWDRESPKKMLFWCAEIALEIERHNGCEIRGKVEWSDLVFAVPKPSNVSLEVVKVLAATV